MPGDVVFVHAIGRRAGVDAWPMQAALSGARFLVRRGFGGDAPLDEYTIDDEGAWLATQISAASVVVGHSWSAVAVLAAALRKPEIRGVVLIEPIATFAAAGDVVVQEHVNSVGPAFERGISLEQFRSRFSAGMGFEVPMPQSAQEEHALDMVRRHRPPWETSMTREDLAGMATPLAVVTGGWSRLYESIGAALAEHGSRASHRSIDGAGHRPQDSPAINELLDWWNDQL